MLTEADAALEAVEFARAAPCGTIKASCPVALAQSALALILPEFLAKYPAVRLQLHVSNRRVDVVSEGFVVALRVRSVPTGEDGLVMRSFTSNSSTLLKLRITRPSSPVGTERTRSATSNPSLTTSTRRLLTCSCRRTAGYFARNSGRISASADCASATGQLALMLPHGAARANSTASSAASASVSIAVACRYTSWPISVTTHRRVERFTRRTLSVPSSATT